jgi:hypothetical protein
MAGRIRYIKIARTDSNGVDITNSLESLSTLVIPSGSSSLTYQINNKTRYPSYYLFLVTPPTNTNISTAITSSVPYKVRTIPTSNNGIAAVQYSAMPVSLGNTSVDNLNLVKSATSNTNPGAGDLNYFDPQTDMQGKQLHVSLIGSASVDGNTGQGFLSIRKGTLDDFNAGAGSSTNIAGTPINPNATSSFDLSTTTTLELGQILYLLVNENVNNFNATNINFTFNTLLNISSSQATGSLKKELVIEPFFTSPFYGTDCDVTYGNASQPVSNPFLQDIDYGDGVITPVNNEVIISGSATKGTVPESFFTVKSILNPTYESVNTVSEYNKEESAFTTQVSSGVFVAYFDSYQTIQRFAQEKYRTRFNLKYLITPEEELIEISNDPDILYTLLYNFGTNANPNTTYDFISTGGTDTNRWGQIDGSVKLRATTFSTGSFDTSADANPLEWKGDYANYLYQGNIQAFAYTTGSIPGISGSSSEFQNVGGILFPASIGLTSAAELPSKAKEILTKNNIIAPSNTTS